jgi:hypothetical protein
LKLKLIFKIKWIARETIHQTKKDHKVGIKEVDFLEMIKCQEESKVLYLQVKTMIQKMQRNSTRGSLKKKLNRKIQICGNILSLICSSILKSFLQVIGNLTRNKEMLKNIS